MDVNEQFPSDLSPADVSKKRAPYRSAGLQISTIRGVPSPKMRPSLSPKVSLQPLKENETIEKPEEVVYLCDHGCGFSGAFGEVSKHEESCSLSPGFVAQSSPPEIPSQESLFASQPIADVPDLQVFDECSVDGPNSNIAIKADPSNSIISSEYKHTPVFYPSPVSNATPQAQQADEFGMDPAAAALMWTTQDLANHTDQGALQLDDVNLFEDPQAVDSVLHEFLGAALNLSSMGATAARTPAVNKAHLEDLINESLSCDNIAKPPPLELNVANLQPTSGIVNGTPNGTAMYPPDMMQWGVPSNQASLYSTAEHATGNTFGDSGKSLQSAGNFASASGPSWGDSASSLLPFTPDAATATPSLMASYDGKGWVEDDRSRKSLGLPAPPLSAPSARPPAQPATPVFATTPLHPSSRPLTNTPVSESKGVAPTDLDLLDVNKLRSRLGLAPLSSFSGKDLASSTLDGVRPRPSPSPYTPSYQSASPAWSTPSFPAAQPPTSSATALSPDILPPSAPPSARSPLSTAALTPSDVDSLRSKYGLPPLAPAASTPAASSVLPPRRAQLNAPSLLNGGADAGLRSWSPPAAAEDRLNGSTGAIPSSRDLGGTPPSAASAPYTPILGAMA